MTGSIPGFRPRPDTGLISGSREDRVPLPTIPRPSCGNLCGTCMDARGLSEDLVVRCARCSTSKELAEWMAAADKVLVF
ncbi:MAG: DsrE family protein [Dechloromonas sp.]|nr:MAG: DsrE family protein [Dechloromonas sp.]